MIAADKDGDFPLIIAATEGYLDIIQYLVEQGAIIEKATKGRTALIVAVTNGQLVATRYLLEQGANRNNAINEGLTPLHYAASSRSHLEIAKLLMVYGADLNARNNDGQLSIDMAIDEEMKQAIRDEPRRRMDHGHKRDTDQDRHPNAATSSSARKKRRSRATSDHVLRRRV